jgi:hypothetical protein
MTQLRREKLKASLGMSLLELAIAGSEPERVTLHLI